jgi:hypothetical protein
MCRLCRLRGQHKHDVTRHHRKAKHNGGTDEKRNISFVRRDLHEAYHLLFGTMRPEQVAQILTAIWIDHEYEMRAMRKDGQSGYL